MNTAQADLFADQGIVKLEGFHPPKALASIRRKLLDDFKQLTASTGGKGLPASLQKLPVFQQIGKLSALVQAPGLHEALMTPELVGCIARLGGHAPSANQGTQLLLSPPHQGPWSLEGLNWHVDIAAEPTDPLPGIQAFFLIDDVAPHGGATLALAGSHRIPTRRSASGSPLREALRRAVDLERQLRDMGIAIVEMSGRAGDVFLMDMRVLHTPSINATKHLRMMATTRCLHA